jgi:hypothetical protein
MTEPFHFVPYGAGSGIKSIRAIMIDDSGRKSFKHVSHRAAPADLPAGLSYRGWGCN